MESSLSLWSLTLVDQNILKRVEFRTSRTGMKCACAGVEHGFVSIYTFLQTSTINWLGLVEWEAFLSLLQMKNQRCSSSMSLLKLNGLTRKFYSQNFLSSCLNNGKAYFVQPWWFSWESFQVTRKLRNEKSPNRSLTINVLEKKLSREKKEKRYERRSVWLKFLFQPILEQWSHVWMCECIIWCESFSFRNKKLSTLYFTSKGESETFPTQLIVVK